jgi:hypothetical protein
MSSKFGGFSLPLVMPVTDKPACQATQLMWICDSYSVLCQTTAHGAVVMGPLKHAVVQLPPM